MKESVEVDTPLQEAILLGLAQRDYERVAGAFIEGFRLSQPSVSRRFQERSRKALEEFEARSLEETNLVALVTDGVTRGNASPSVRAFVFEALALREA